MELLNNKFNLSYSKELLYVKTVCMLDKVNSLSIRTMHWLNHGPSQTYTKFCAKYVLLQILKEVASDNLLGYKNKRVLVYKLIQKKQISNQCTRLIRFKKLKLWKTRTARPGVLNQSIKTISKSQHFETLTSIDIRFITKLICTNR